MKSLVDLTLNGVSAFTAGGGGADLPPPDRLDETDASVFYFGWESVSGGWLIQRQTRADGQSLSATQSNNPALATLDDAWAGRATLTYG